MTEIVRMWRGWIRTADRDAYAAYLQRTGLADYAAVEGNLDASALYRDRGDGSTEVVTLSRWTSMEAVRGFAGDEPAVARFYPEDDRYLTGREPFVTHFEVAG